MWGQDYLTGRLHCKFPLNLPVMLVATGDLCLGSGICSKMVKFCSPILSSFINQNAPQKTLPATNSLATLNYSWFLSMLQTKLGMAISQHLRNLYINIFDVIHHIVVMLTNVQTVSSLTSQSPLTLQWDCFAKALIFLFVFDSLIEKYL